MIELKDIERLIEEGKFYKTIEWRRMRERILHRDNFECQRCKEHGRYSRGGCVHHIKHLKDNPMLALEEENLVTLCFECHNIVHPEKQKTMYALINQKKLENLKRKERFIKDSDPNSHGKLKRQKVRFTNEERW